MFSSHLSSAYLHVFFHTSAVTTTMFSSHLSCGYISAFFTCDCVHCGVSQSEFLVFSGFLQAHVSYLDAGCEVCLLLLSVDHNSFFTLSESKDKIKAVSLPSRWHCEHTMFCVEVFYALCISFHSFMHGSFLLLVSG